MPTSSGIFISKKPIKTYGIPPQQGSLTKTSSKLTKEELQRIKFDPEEFTRLGLNPESLENFIILDGSDAPSSFYQPLLLKDIRNPNPVIHSGYMKCAWGKFSLVSSFYSSCNDIKIVIDPKQEYNVLSVQDLQNENYSVDLENYCIKTNGNDHCCSIYLIGSQFCILATSINNYPLYFHTDHCRPRWQWPFRSVVEINSTDIHFLFCNVDVKHIKELINSGKIKGFKLIAGGMFDTYYQKEDLPKEPIDEEWVEVNIEVDMKLQKH